MHGICTKPADRVAGEPQVVFQPDLGRVLRWAGAAQHFCQSGGGHRARRADHP